jgi:hypothetical protein
MRARLAGDVRAPDAQAFLLPSHGGLPVAEGGALGRPLALSGGVVGANRLVFGQLYNVGVNYGIAGKVAQPPAIIGDELFNAPRRLGSPVNAPLISMNALCVGCVLHWL